MFTHIRKSIYGKTIALLLACLISTTSFAAPGNGKVVTLKAGTPVNLELIQNIKSKSARMGQLVEFRVLNDVVAENEVVIPAGSIAKGQVMSVTKQGLMGRAGELSVEIKSVTAVDGTEIPLMSTELNDEGSNNLVVAITLTIICFWGFLISGGKAEIPAGTMIRSSVLSNTEIAIN